MTPELEAAVLKESDKALTDLIEAFLNVGLRKTSISFMLITKAEELDENLIETSAIASELPN